MIPDLSQVETATLGHFLNDGFLAPSIQGLFPDRRIWGPALTVRLPGSDGWALVEALSVIEPGAVLVIDRCGDLRHACFGAVAAQAAFARGVAGVVIDGFITDRAALQTLGLPIWCRGRSPITTRNRRLGGAVGGSISCGGAMVSCGDIILADGDGVVVLDPARTAAHATMALDIQEKERDILRRIRAGETLRDITSAATPSDRAALRHVFPPSSPRRPESR